MLYLAFCGDGDQKQAGQARNSKKKAPQKTALSLSLCGAIGVASLLVIAGEDDRRDVDGVGKELAVTFVIGHRNRLADLDIFG